MTDRQIPPDQCGRTIVHGRHDTDEGWCPGLYASDVRPPDTTAARNAAAQLPLPAIHLGGTCTPCASGAHADDGTGAPCRCCGRRPLVCPECRNGKHRNCEPAWDPDADTTAPCTCTHGSPA